MSFMTNEFLPSRLNVFVKNLEKVQKMLKKPGKQLKIVKKQDCKHFHLVNYRPLSKCLKIVTYAIYIP